MHTDWQVSMKRLLKQLWVGTCQIHQAVRKILSIGWSPSGVSQTVAEAITNVSEDEQKTLINGFIGSKQQELGTVMIGSALVSSLVASLLSWSWFPEPPYPAKVAMLCALLHSLVGLGVSSQQSVALSRVSLHPRRTDIISEAVLGHVVGSRTQSNNTWTQGSGWRHFSWQIPTMLLGNSIVLVVVGLAIAIFHQAQEAAVWGPEVITALCFSISLFYIVGCYFTSWVCIEWRIQLALKGP